MKVLKKLLVLIMAVTVLSALFVINASAADLAYGAGTVNCTDLNVRSEANTKSSVIITLRHNDIVVIMSKTNGEWYKINFKGTEGYVSAQYLSNVLTAENFTASGSVIGSDVNMRSTHSTSGKSLGTYPTGTVMPVIGINDGWYKVKYKGNTGYIRSDFLKLVPDSKAAVKTTPEVTAASSTPAPSTFGDKVVSFAMKYVGYDYVYGGASPSSGFDCSGFTYYVFGQLGHSISRTASQQYINNGQSVSRAAIEPGDLLFFSCDGSGEVSHVGIYIGDSKFVNAENSYAGVTVCSLDSSYWNSAYYAAKRVG